MDGILDSFPICASFAFVFSGVGALSNELGFTFSQSTLSTAAIFAAPLQAFVSRLMHDGDVALLLSATLLANFRFALMGAVIKRYFSDVSRWKVFPSMLFLSASTYAVTHTGLSGRQLSGQRRTRWKAASSPRTGRMIRATNETLTTKQMTATPCRPNVGRLFLCTTS